MSRLLCFGCSHVYGLGLSDCLTVNHSPSKLGFPNMVGKQLGIEVLNLADTGASQKQIAATILQTKIKKDDIVIINWSNPIRRGIWNGVHWEQLAPWTTEKSWIRYFKKYHRDIDDYLDSAMNINLANYYLENKCRQVINSLHSPAYEWLDKTFTWNNVKFDITFKPTDSNVYYKNLECGHPDLKSHKIFAERLLKLIK